MDILYGGRGDDRINGGSGSDIVNAGPGRDLVRSGSGHDVIERGRDGRADRIECGRGVDTVAYRGRRDANDELIGCEHVVTGEPFGAW